MTDDKRERRRQAAQKYYAANRDRLVAQMRARRTENVEAARAAKRASYYKHREQNRARSKRRRDETHREVTKAQKAASARRNILSIRAYQQKWGAANRQRVNQASKQARWRLKLKIIAAYGGACRCCSEETPEFLSIDHIDGTGAHARKQGQGTGDKFYRWLLRQGCPTDNYRLLCFNCNCARGMFGYCPHELAIDALVAPQLV